MSPTYRVYDEMRATLSKFHESALQQAIHNYPATSIAGRAARDEACSRAWNENDAPIAQCAECGHLHYFPTVQLWNTCPICADGEKICVGQT